MSEEKEFENILNIDKTRLDDEAENQPYLVWDYGRMTAKALKALDEAKASLKVVEAELDVAVREKPHKYGLSSDKKPTESAIKSAVLRSKHYQKANQIFIDAQYRVNMLEAANKSLDHRRTSLSMLDGQDTRNYYSRPKQSVKTESDEFGARHKRLKKKRRNAQL